MCCTFGDTTDLTVTKARHQILQALPNSGQWLEQQPTSQTVRTHERCDTPIEYIV